MHTFMLIYTHIHTDTFNPYNFRSMSFLSFHPLTGCMFQNKIGFKLHKTFIFQNKKIKDVQINYVERKMNVSYIWQQMDFTLIF